VALLDRIEAMGGTLAAIETGFIQMQIQEAAYKAQVAIDSGQSIVVGVNRYGDPSRGSQPLFRLEPEGERRQCLGVQSVRADRDAGRWQAALDRVATAARDGANLVPPIVTAVESMATVGEISDTLRTVFGEFEDTAAV
jgi:methylmalonyl-CoA mutase N-terminal domain/subunit